jgi:hypothetical protein
MSVKAVGMTAPGRCRIANASSAWLAVSDSHSPRVFSPLAGARGFAQD